MAGQYLFVSPSLTPCPAVCLLPLFHLCYHFSIHPLLPPSCLPPPLHFLAFSSPTPVCLPFPFVLLMSFNLLPPVFPPSLIFLASIASFSFFQLSLPFLSLFSLIWTPFSDPLPPHLSSTPACPSLPLPPSPGFRCSHDFSPSLFQAPPPRSPLSIIINDKG